MLAAASGPRGRSRTAVVSLPGRADRLHLRPRATRRNPARAARRPAAGALASARRAARARSPARGRRPGSGPGAGGGAPPARRLPGGAGHPLRGADARRHRAARLPDERSDAPARRLRGGLRRARVPRRRRASLGSARREPALPRSRSPGRGVGRRPRQNETWRSAPSRRTDGRADAAAPIAGQARPARRGGSPRLRRLLRRLHRRGSGAARRPAAPAAARARPARDPRAGLAPAAAPRARGGAGAPRSSRAAPPAARLRTRSRAPARARPPSRRAAA